MTDTTLTARVGEALGRIRRLDRDSEEAAHTDIGDAWDTINFARDVLRDVARKLVPPVDLVCDNCGSNDLIIEASVSWDAEAQELVAGDMFDKGHLCNECGGECRIKEVPHKPLCLAFEYGQDPATDETLKKAFYFQTQPELTAFREGVQASEGWLEFDITYTDEEL